MMNLDKYSLIQIFTFLDFDGIVSLSLVNKRLSVIGKNDIIWKSLFHRCFGEKIEDMIVEEKNS